MPEFIVLYSGCDSNHLVSYGYQLFSCVCYGEDLNVTGNYSYYGHWLSRQLAFLVLTVSWGDSSVKCVLVADITLAHQMLFYKWSMFLFY